MTFVIGMGPQRMGVGLAALLATGVLLAGAGCPHQAGQGDDAGVDAGPDYTAHVVVLHSNDGIGYLEPCG